MSFLDHFADLPDPRSLFRIFASFKKHLSEYDPISGPQPLLTR